MKIHVQSPHSERLDLYLTKELPDLSRSRIQSLLKSGNILLNNNSAKAKTTVVSGDMITVHLPEETSDEIQAQELPLDILYEDNELIVLNKESGMVVHPAAGNKDGTLVNALLHHCNGKLAPIGGEDRPGIVHRLDKDTSGCIIVAKTDATHQGLVKQFSERSTEKEYITVVQGMPTKPEDTIITHIGRHPVNRMKMAVVDETSGKIAITDYKVLYYDDTSNSSLIHCKIHTGRTHQIRVHMHHIRCPILGDVIYAKIAKQKAKTNRLMLHARKLCITHPITQDRLEFHAPLPVEYEKWWEKYEEK